jgi:hypothetical protein
MGNIGLHRIDDAQAAASTNVGLMSGIVVLKRELHVG